MKLLLSEAKICKLNPPTLKLYENLLAHLPQPNETTTTVDRLEIPWQQRSIIIGAVDLTKGRLQDSTIPELQKYLESTDSNEYEEAVKELFQEFFVSRRDFQAHSKILNGVYIRQHRVEFWKLYWSIFQFYLIEKKEIVDICNILELWFKSSANLVKECRYVVPEFFTELPEIIEAIQSDKKYRRIERELKLELRKRDWYPVIEKYFQKSGKGFLGNLFNL